MRRRINRPARFSVPACIICCVGLLTCAASVAQSPSGATPAPAAGAAANRAVATATSPDGKAAARVITVTAVVEAVDAGARTLLLRGPKGRTLAVDLDERVKNLDTLKVGDRVSVRVAQAVAVSLRRQGNGIRELSVRQAAVGSPGESGGVAAGQLTTIVANIWAIDRKTKTVSLRGPKGSVVDVQIEDETRLEGLGINDQVEVQYLQAIALGLTRLPK